MTETDFKNFFNERMKERGFTIKKLSETSGIAPKHLENLSNGDFEKLPPAPYLRGYLERLGRVLEFDSEYWWENFKEMDFLASSEKTDKLPENRFAKRISKKGLWVTVAILVFAIYLTLRFSQIFGEPLLVITYPAENPTVLKISSITLQGKVSAGGQVFVNGDLALRKDDGGVWEKSVLLQPGLNTLEITAKKFLGREKKIIRQVIYEPTTSPYPEATSTGQTF